MLGTAIFLIVSSLILLLLTAITEIITDWWAYLLIGLVSAIFVMCDSYKRKK